MVSEQFKLDKDNLWYLDSKDIQIEEIILKNNYEAHRDDKQFYRIKDIDNYIIKDCAFDSFFFNGRRNKNMLKELMIRQKKLPDIDFPVGYYKDRGKVKGIIIPYYENAISIRKFISLYRFQELKDFYNHDSNEIDNCIALLLDILDLLNKMCENRIYYIDVHSGNLLLYNNQIKIIDFEPNYVFFKDKKGEHYHQLLVNYAILVSYFFHRLGFRKIYFSASDDFYSTEKKVKALRKELER